MSLTTAYLNRIATAAPRYDVHSVFVHFARSLLPERPQRLFDRMAGKSGISSRYSVLAPAANQDEAVDAEGLYPRGAFAGTARRMAVFEREAPQLAEHAFARLELSSDEVQSISHVIVTSCTGMYAPGLDWDLMTRCGLRPTVERTVVGFMGCFAAINALKLARHIVRSDARARVLIVNVELCTLHLHETTELEQTLSFLVFGDGCAASIVSAVPAGLALQSFHSERLLNTADLITWRVGDSGFDMFLSGQVPQALRAGLRESADHILSGHQGRPVEHWAVHPGGRSVLDAVEEALDLPSLALDASRSVLDRYGNMSSPSVMFVLAELLGRARPGERGCAMSFGPGLTAETFLFEKV